MKNPEILIHYLDVLLRDSNFTKAAQELHISQPYLTQLLKRVEKQLGAKIINRDTVPFSLTKAGIIYYKYLETAIANEQNLAQELLPYSRPDKKVIKLSVLESLGTFLLPKLLPNFLEKNPHIEIQLIEASPRQSEALLLQEQIDCYLGQTPETTSKGIDCYINGGEKYYIVISPKSKLFKPGKFILAPDTYNIKEILQEPFIISSSSSAIRHQVDGIFQKFHVKPNIVLQSSSIITATSLAIQGVGLTVSAASIIKMIAQTPINLLPINANLVAIKYFIAAKQGLKHTPILEKLIQEFLQLDIEPNIN